MADGGALYDDGHPVALTNVTFSGNTPDDES
jgi:hypothetical protein